MKTQQLPPELVEKMQTAIDSLERPLTASEKCAKIAVEYAGDIQKRNTVLSFKNKDLYNENFSLKQQRDELLEALKTVRICSNYREVKAKHGNCDNWVNIIDELINKIDGK